MRRIEFFAHICDRADGTMAVQTVLQHLRGTAKRSAECVRGVGLGNAAYLAGLLHDLGKCTRRFQAYLAEGDSSQRGSVIHTFQGCRYVLEKYRRMNADLSEQACEILAFAIGAHHGLFDCVDAAGRIGLQYRMEKQDIDYEESVRAFFDQDIREAEVDDRFDAALRELSAIIQAIDEDNADDQEYCFQIGLLARLLLSALIEGDRHDTAAFMNLDCVNPDSKLPNWQERLQHMEAKLRAFPSEDAISQARSAISAQCKSFAAEPAGIYRLNVPTGGGKTLSSLRYALAHADRFQKRRLIFTSPLLSILEQNARVIREYIGDDALILEHHSNVVQTDDSGDALDARELMIQSWDAPIIITTMVQLLNTLFDGKTSAIRRFQALCDSVIVIDEVQTVPTKLLSMFNLAIRFLHERCNATVVLCSATQPCLEKTAHALRSAPKDIVPYDANIWKTFKRTQIICLGNERLENLPNRIRHLMEDTNSLLVICNQKREAAYLWEYTRSSEYESHHLSAAMCMQHRRDTVAALRDALSNGRRVLCISTQVIEAGVDISFGCVLRLTAGMDSIVQAAGRCNRNGESQSPRPVYTINCSDERLGMLRDIQRGKDATIELMYAFQQDPKRFDDDLASDAAIAYYYHLLYQNMNSEEQDFHVPRLNATELDLLAMNEKYTRNLGDALDSVFLRQAFKTAGQAFSVFDENTTDVLVPYGQGKEYIQALCSQRAQYDLAYRADILRKLNGYTVSIYPYQKKQLEKNQALTAICDGSVLALRAGDYDAITGLTALSSKLELWEV